MYGATVVAIFPAIGSAILQWYYPDGWNPDGDMLKNSQVWAGFSFLVGFLAVFRTSQSYIRFCEGCTASHGMRAELFDACSSVVAFCKQAKSDNSEVIRFKELLVRLVSMFHAAALAELEKGDRGHVKDLYAHHYNLIDPESIDRDSLRTIRNAEDRVELIFMWVQQLIVENISTGVLAIPPPLLSRTFQELANAMVQFHDAMRIATVPLPFPYAQTCDWMLTVHVLVVPIVTATWVGSPVWAFLFTLIQVLVLWSLNLVALEIENPFGTDANDIDGFRMQDELNRHLMLLLDENTTATPYLRKSTTTCDLELHRMSTFDKVLTEDLHAADNGFTKTLSKAFTPISVMWSNLSSSASASQEGQQQEAGSSEDVDMGYRGDMDDHVIQTDLPVPPRNRPAPPDLTGGMGLRAERIPSDASQHTTERMPTGPRQHCADHSTPKSLGASRSEVGLLAACSSCFGGSAGTATCMSPASASVRRLGKGSEPSCPPPFE